MSETTMNDVRKFFGYEKLGEFRNDWQLLSAVDKEQLKAGIGNGSLTY